MKSNGHKVQESIRIEAYLLSEKAGHPSGMEDVFWVEAESIVRGRQGEAAKAPAATKLKSKKSKVSASTAAKPAKAEKKKKKKD